MLRKFLRNYTDYKPTSDLVNIELVFCGESGGQIISWEIMGMGQGKTKIRRALGERAE
jgi:hypothetical protein